MKYVYIIQSTESGYFKIGVSKKPKYRIKQLQTANSSKLILISEYSSDIANKLEKALHNLYSYCKKEGEWFDLPLTEAHTISEQCETIEKNILFLQKNGNAFI